ncbi:MAG: aminotransferase class V-fold PLP-dependent enzyme [Candidatus Krumholzibacteriota bacterium]|nr:aminotransferase class V-fold PLP-dependent enzyme [Candidatus Krumholzibacteriota bacterium]
MDDRKEIFLDHNSARATRSEAVEEMSRLFADGFGNPQSVHDRGQRAAEKLENARAEVASLVGADPEDIIFTATGSEANNMAVKGIARARKNRSNRVIISPIEHHSVAIPADSLRKEGFELVTLPVDSTGLIDPDSLAKAVSDGAALVSVIHASTEIGTIEPIRELAAICAEKGVPFHTDSWGTAGSIKIDCKDIPLNAMTIAGQNFGGPPGAAALVIRKGVPMKKLIEGGVQERNRRAGQENIPAIAGMGIAARLALREIGQTTAALVPLRDMMIKNLIESIEDVILTGHPEKRLPGHASFCVKYIEGEGLLLFLNQKGIMAASGSACTSRSLKGSHVLEAIGLDAATAQGSVVFTLGPENGKDEIGKVIDEMKPVVSRLREMSPIYREKKNGAL